MSGHKPNSDSDSFVSAASETSSNASDLSNASTEATNLSTTPSTDGDPRSSTNTGPGTTIEGLGSVGQTSHSTTNSDNSDILDWLANQADDAAADILTAASALTGTSGWNTSGGGASGVAVTCTTQDKGRFRWNCRIDKIDRTDYTFSHPSTGEIIHIRFTQKDPTDTSGQKIMLYADGQQPTESQASTWRDMQSPDTRHSSFDYVTDVPAPSRINLRGTSKSARPFDISDHIVPLDPVSTEEGPSRQPSVQDTRNMFKRVGPDLRAKFNLEPLS
jgi:hypothetical protein